MRRIIRKSLENLKQDEVKTLRLVPGTPSNDIVRGCHLFEPKNEFGEEYKGLVIHRSPKGNQVVTIERAEQGKNAVFLHHINLRRYDQNSGKINYGGRLEIYFPGDEGYQIIDGKLRELGI